MMTELTYDAPSLPASSRAIFTRTYLVTIASFLASLAAAGLVR